MVLWLVMVGYSVVGLNISFIMLMVFGVFLDWLLLMV